MLLFGVSLACYSPSLRSVQDQAYQAPVVVEGKVQGLVPAGGPGPNGTREPPAAGRVALVRVLDKWPLRSGGLQREQLISVGSCAPLERNQRYIFFLEPTEQPLVFKTAFAPLDTNGKNLKKEVGKILCTDCGESPPPSAGPGGARGRGRCRCPGLGAACQSCAAGRPGGAGRGRGRWPVPGGPRLLAACAAGRLPRSPAAGQTGRRWPGSASREWPSEALPAVPAGLPAQAAGVCRRRGHTPGPFRPPVQVLRGKGGPRPPSSPGLRSAPHTAGADRVDFS